MNETRSQSSSIGLVMGGAVGALLVVAAAWGVWMWLQPDAPPTEPVQAVDPVVATEQQDAVPLMPVPVVTPPPVEPEPEPIAVASSDESEPAADVEPDDGREKTPEEILMEKARRSAEQYAEQANADDGFEAERSFLEAKFDERKKQFIDMIDGYFAQPDDKRDEYLQKIGEEFRKQAEAERLAAGLPAQPHNQGRMFQEFMRMGQEKMSDEEKTKIKEFMGDIIKRQTAKFQAQLERHLDGPPRE